MSNTKVQFHPLERLDIVDVDAIQDLISKYVDDALGGLSLLGGAAATTANTAAANGGVLTPLSFTVSGTTLIPNDFAFIAPKKNGTITGHSGGRVGLYNSGAAGNSVPSFLVSRQAAQAYYNANSNTLPPVPGSASYSTATHGASYPKIYARVERTSTTPDTRRFWDVADGVEESRSVNTRKTPRVTFATVADGTNPSVISEGDDSSDFVLVAQIIGWSVVAGAVSAPSSYLFHTLADALFPMDATAPYKKLASEEGLSYALAGGGVKGLASLIRRAMVQLKTSGSSDSTIPAAYSVDTGEFATAPRYSVDGLAGAVRTLRARHRNSSMIITARVQNNGSATLTLSHNVRHAAAGGGATLVFDEGVPASMGEFFPAIRVRRDFTLYDELNFTIDPESVGLVSSNTVGALSAYAAGFFFELPAAYAGWGVRATMTPLEFTSSIAGAFTRVPKPRFYMAESSSTIPFVRAIPLDVIDATGAVTSRLGFRVICPLATAKFSAGTTSYPDTMLIDSTAARTYEFSFAVSVDLFPPSEFSDVDAPNS